MALAPARWRCRTAGPSANRFWFFLCIESASCPSGFAGRLPELLPIPRRDGGLAPIGVLKGLSSVSLDQCMSHDKPGANA